MLIKRMKRNGNIALPFYAPFIELAFIRCSLEPVKIYMKYVRRVSTIKKFSSKAKAHSVDLPIFHFSCSLYDVMHGLYGFTSRFHILTASDWGEDAFNCYRYVLSYRFARVFPFAGTNCNLSILGWLNLQLATQPLPCCALIKWF